jgi:hypothetical protein
MKYFLLFVLIGYLSNKELGVWWKEAGRKLHSFVTAFVLLAKI